MNQVAAQIPNNDTDEVYRHHVFARAWPALAIEAGFKQQPEDFRVDEILPFSFSGSGEHLWLQVRKRGCNTDWLAQQLGKLAGVKPVAVGYAGLKDRHAVTTQWFSIHLPGRPDPDFSVLLSDDIQIVQQLRHSKKLQRGALSGNRFEIRLRNVSQQDLLAERCGLIKKAGVPNYFGEQRFGRGRGNMLEAERMFSHPRARLPRHKRSLYLSAARSWMFNEMLSRRIQAGSWIRRLGGEVFMLDGKSACFPDDGSEALDARLAAGELHPTAVMWGEGESMSTDAVYALEQSVADAYPVLSAGLLAARVESQRRALRLLPRTLEWVFDQADCIVSFALPAGSYATTVLRELVDVRQPQSR
jgi:tRNA pseudouridine13 synthase